MDGPIVYAKHFWVVLTLFKWPCVTVLDWFRSVGLNKELEKRVLGHKILTTSKQMFEEKEIHTLLLSWEDHP